MDLSEILNTSIIDLQVQGNTKKEVLTNLAQLLLANDYIDDVDQFVSDIYVREAEGPTGMGSGLSIPHGKSESVKKIGIAIGRTVNPIKWESSIELDGFQDTHLIFLFCVSADNSFAENHMILLSQLAGKLGNEARVQALSNATSADEIVNLILADDDQLEGAATSDESIVDLDIDF